MLIVTCADAGQSGAAGPRPRLPAEAGRCRAITVGASTVLVTEHGSDELARRIAALPGVRRVVHPVVGAPLASRGCVVEDSAVAVGPVRFGGGGFTVIAGPCAVEGRSRLRRIAGLVRACGASALRGGAYKPRTSPHAFQGVGQPGLRDLRDVGRGLGLPVVTEVVDVHTLPQVVEHADVVQVGTRNAQNFPLLREVGRAGCPVLLKRGFGCTVDEWLGAAEYVLAEGNDRVVLCERGIRTFEAATRFTLDLSAVAVLKHTSHLPVVVDPSHSTGHPELVRPMALAAAAAGADGLLVDVHDEPGQARCDGGQALRPEGFRALMADLVPVLHALGRPLVGPTAGRTP
ncbi:3-deoxy-7-phosphoheptulonate synthase [Goodfellowiella coeruleoviolacea]|uniref:3-deoxy-D-arabinoheptulosonate-7-phosphate synthase n=1 Tax=Goodfellowiella coeruleoviolacea TaxID=334858 RepID=A0AAE3KP14_9PSEU|nr:3-deoxy-7-phosphoheptulonate synthase [Goodfellowiella coeruleoviolacea]MCP2169328.1 3-deoxy-D-arabinoheptulosonate-7-phosphate synthase [Goodfellowiella coeruleoviolacea]